jgi:hypothetical protein
VRVLQGFEPSIDEGAQRALAQWTYRPAMHLDNPSRWPSPSRWPLHSTRLPIHGDDSSG